MNSTEIKGGVFWVGAVDWNVRDFHGYSTPQGSTYNAYLVKDKKIALFDTVKKPLAGDLVQQIRQVVDPSKIDYIVVNHVEMDHSGALPEIVELVKPEKIFCSAQGRKALLAHFHREDWPYEVVSSGQAVSLGKKTVRFIETKMLHWPDSMFSYIEEDHLLISQDAFGQHWATSARFDDEVDPSEIMRHSAKYYANIIMPYSTLVQRLIADLSAMGIEMDMIAPDHGLIWRSDPGRIIRAWDEWSRGLTSNKAIVVYDTMWQSTEAMAKAIADGLQKEGVNVKVMNLGVCHRSDVATELLDAGAVIVGSPTLNNGVLPRVADVLCYLKGLRPVGKVGAAFASYGWGGESLKLVNSALEEMKIELVDPGLKVMYVPDEEDLKRCVELGKTVAAAMGRRTEL